LCCKESAKKRIGAVDEIYEEGGIVKVSRN
jgi:hypothetical protein